MTNYYTADSHDVHYQLYSVTIHEGEIDNGHYTIYIKDFINNQWILYNDNLVYYISNENEVYKNKNTGENRTIIEIPLFDETDKRRIRKYLSSLKDPAAAAKNGPPRGLPCLFRTSKVLVLPVKTDYNERDRNHDRKPD